jgi:hypothetical protein
METARLVFSIFLFFLACFLSIHWLWRRSRAKKAIHWPATEGTIESGGMEVVANVRGNKVTLPVFAFSYRVQSGYFSGRFALLPYITDPDPHIIERMIGRKLQIRVDPQNAKAWFIADDLIEGCRIEQKLSPYAINLKPAE